MLTPQRRYALVISLLQREVNHRTILSGAVPVPLGGLDQTTSPALRTSTSPSERPIRARPHMTSSAWPNGWLCHAVRAPGLNVTRYARSRVGASTISCSHTWPVNHSLAPAGCDDCPRETPP